MTDTEIIKALECCSEPAGKCCCEVCPLHHREDSCTTALIKKAVELVNRQKAEIERLQKMQQLIKSEAIKEFAEKIAEVFMRYAHLHNYADQARVAQVESVDGTKIEMQSVWDVLTLKKYDMVEYEEMGELQHNIEYIANDRLLTELEKDFRLLVKEMTENEGKE